MVRNGSHRGRHHYHCRSCQTYFGETQGTPMYGLKTPAAEVAQGLLIVMRRGSLRGAEEIKGHTYETICVWLKRAATEASALTQVLANDLHLSQVEIDEFWSFVQKKTLGWQAYLDVCSFTGNTKGNFALGARQDCHPRKKLNGKEDLTGGVA